MSSSPPEPRQRPSGALAGIDVPGAHLEESEGQLFQVERLDGVQGREADGFVLAEAGGQARQIRPDRIELPSGAYEGENPSAGLVASFERPNPEGLAATVIVPRGAGVDDIAKLLAQNQVIEDAFVFSFGVRVKRMDALFEIEREKIAWRLKDKTAYDKIIAVLEGDLMWSGVIDLNDLPRILVERLQHYFSTYKLIPGDDATPIMLQGTYGRDHAAKVVAQEEWPKPIGSRFEVGPDRLERLRGGRGRPHRVRRAARQRGRGRGAARRRTGSTRRARR